MRSSLHKMRVLSFILTLCVLCVLSSCLLPPSSTAPIYLGIDEFEELSTLSSAKRLAATGRFNSAELLYREALKTNPRNLIALNDLGYLLLSTERAPDALLILEKAIEVEPLFLASHINRAKALVLLERFDEAIVEYSNIEDILLDNSRIVLQQINGGLESQLPQVSSINRLFASTYYLMGSFDDAVCESWLAQIRSGSIYEAQLHSRLLLSLELLPQAHELLSGAIAVHQDSLPSSMVFDFALTLIAEAVMQVEGSLDNARGTEFANSADVVLEMALRSETLSPKKRIAARLIRLQVAPEAMQQVISNAQETDMDELCSVSEFDTDGYWPYDAVRLIMESQRKVCSNG